MYFILSKRTRGSPDDSTMAIRGASPSDADNKWFDIRSLRSPERLSSRMLLSADIKRTNSLLNEKISMAFLYTGSSLTLLYLVLYEVVKFFITAFCYSKITAMSSNSNLKIKVK